MNITKIIGGLAIAGGIGIIATPIIYQKQIDKFISIQTKNLEQQNISIQEKENKDSFFNISREYIITIKDITPIVNKIYPNINPYTLKDLKENFDNTQFIATINMSKYPISHKDAIKIALFKLNKSITKDLNKEFTGKELLSFIKNKGLEIKIDTNSLNIKKAKLKDIDLTLHKKANSKEQINLLVKNGYTTFNSTISTNIDTFKFHMLLDTIMETTFNLQKLKYDFSKQNDFNYKTKSKIANISYKLKEKSVYKTTPNIIKIDFKNITSSSDVHSIVNNLNIINSFNTKNITFQSNKNLIQLYNFDFNTKLEKLDLANIKTLYTLLQQQNPNTQKIQKSIQNIINKGFSIKINPLSLDKATANISNKTFDISKIKILFNAQLKPNQYKLQTNPQYLLQFINADLNIDTTDKNIQLLTKLNPITAIYLATVSTKTKNGIKINISYKNGKLISNGKVLFQ